jgi:hypothetical protein
VSGAERLDVFAAVKPQATALGELGPLLHGPGRGRESDSDGESGNGGAGPDHPTTISRLAAAAAAVIRGDPAPDVASLERRPL